MQINELTTRIYYITHPEITSTGELTRLILQMINAGVGMIQYRVKNLTTRDMIEQAMHLVKITRSAKVPFLINDRVDVALATGADGVHVGADDMQVAYCRRLLGPSAIIGATANSPRDARIAQKDGATYLTVGPVFSYSTRPEETPVGLEGLAQIRSVTGLPICAIGGIQSENIKDLAHAGADLVAVMSSIHKTGLPLDNARELVAAARSFTWPHIAP